ncbi:Anucleate primary sterigmata protein B [Cadophora gregata]|uniref:Anucleate primary sterigmata protein B n=1 Tax=Cadophora gregata TaxID=51156 RepID=UPI0026DBAE29|nr:Anucleate primary sterigmata protein B [Cadophora gregata]KAK0101808.1 Anucleate primary sterigmata protein B [Cadophora gregata]KAK0106177.1 Anucleate primary sterigmata protein B [Cadophora gregata f. sp. sojae]
MAEGEEHPETAIASLSTGPEERPQTARKDSRKVPGGFGIDDLDDLSPDKKDFDDSIFENAPVNTEEHKQNNRIPSLDPATLPSLPPPGDSSILSNPSENGGGSDALGDTVDERAMQRHLNDVESSFMPIPSPISMDGKKGADDTYLFDGAQPPPRDQQRSPERSFTPSKSEPKDQVLDVPLSPPTPANAYQTPGIFRANSDSMDETMDTGDTTSALETMSSSPTAAAAARTVSRAISMASAGGYDAAYDGDDYSQGPTDNEDDVEATPRKKKGNSFTESSDNQSTLKDDASNQSRNTSFGDAGSTPGVALLNRKSSGRRPKFLRSRHASQHSSVSSFITNPDDGSDITLGADYALQSGGAVPADGFSRSSMGLSRSISLGSMASGIEDFSGPGQDGSFATLTEEEQNRERKPGDMSPPETPRATTARSSLAAPTDTVIARHVRNVQVPASVAQEYRNKNGVSPRRSGFAASTLGRNGKNMTLKEQSSTIERLSKENFDLKLKVMFLSDRLDKLSEEGVKEMISENVELKTGLAVMQRDNKALKRKVKDLEKQLKDDEERPSTAGTSGGDPSPKWFDQEGAQEREEELMYLRERTEEYITEIEKMRNDAIIRENEKRNLAEVVRQMGERRGQNVEAREEMDVWKDLLEQETSRREQADDENKKLREEIFRLKTETTSSTGMPGLNHTTNIYNITKKRQVSPSRPRSGMSFRDDDRTGAMSSATTLAEDLRREAEQLRHENAELRREVGAQTSMLTSRNREKERLYQEIEDLKLGQRRGGGSIAGDSILDRSASRAHERSSSRNSVGTRITNMDDTEREDFENKHAELRDRINSLKIHNQDLQRELESCMEDFETAVQQKKDAETLASELQEALELAEADLVTMQTDRDEALQGQEEAEIMFESLRKEAQEELDGFAEEADEANAEIERLRTELADTTENFNALQNEMREMSEGLVRLEDDHEGKARRIEELERELEEANRELEQMENNLVEANGKINRLTVQQESSQGEIAFLREEQDGDKIKIGDLEAAVKNAEDALHEERERIKELEERLNNERYQREVVAGREKQEVQQVLNDLNREASGAKDEARRLRKSLTSREVEAAEWKQRLMELESNLREALGDLNGTRSSLLNSIAKLQRELENTIRDLDATKASLGEKERLIKHRDSLLESHALESRKLADMLDKERQTHRNTKHQFETFQKTQQHTTRTLTQQESRVLELETSRQQDRRKIATLENNFKDQMNERNQLLLALWNRLSALCGSDWTHNNSLINGRALPSLEAVSTMLPGFSKNLLAAVKTIETLVGDFRSRIRSVEKDLWKEYQTLESNLEIRTKRLDRLETMARSGIPGIGSDGKAEIMKLTEKNRALKKEVSALRAAVDVRSNTFENPSPSPSIPTGPRNRSVDKSRTSTLTRNHSTSAVETVDRRAVSRAGSNSTGEKSVANSVKEDYMPDMRWQLRLQELEYKLKAEREARLVDRSSARQRLEEKDRENANLLAQVERSKVRENMGR